MQSSYRCISIGALRPLLFAACVALASCQPDVPGKETGAQPQNESDGIDLSSVPLPTPPLDRAALLAAVARTASAVASGADMSADQRQWDGTAFEVRIRFGCEGASSDFGKAPFGWDFDESRRRLRVRALPTISEKEELAAHFPGGSFEAVEGFWIPRPWIFDPVCPVTAEEKPAAGASERIPDEIADLASATPQRLSQGIGIAQFFTSAESRTRRRSTRAYQAIKTLEPDQSAGRHGFNLVLSGRLKALPGGEVISCSVKSPDEPPECIISASFDRVWIEDPDSRKIIAEWGGG